MNNRQEQIEQAKRLIATSISEELVEVLHQQFPELKESEDKRIINQLISLVRSTGGVVIIPTNQEELITYLERMKEQKPEIKYVYPIFKVGDTIKPKAYNESHRINKIKDDNYILDNGFTFPIVGQDVWEIVEQQPAEWSEEDEKCIKDIVNCLEYLEKEDTERQYNGDRNVNPKRYIDMIAKLKSIRPQPHWKPSKEQMDALKLAYEDAFECPESGVPHMPLKSLLSDLQKLL